MFAKTRYMYNVSSEAWPLIVDGSRSQSAVVSYPTVHSKGLGELAG